MQIDTVDPPASDTDAQGGLPSSMRTESTAVSCDAPGEQEAPLRYGISSGSSRRAKAVILKHNARAKRPGVPAPREDQA